MKILPYRGSWCNQRYAACKAKQRHHICSGIGGVGDGHLVVLSEEHKRTGGKYKEGSEGEINAPSS